MTYTLTPSKELDGFCLVEGPGIKLWLTDFSQEVIDRLNAQAEEIERLREETSHLRTALEHVTLIASSYERNADLCDPGMDLMNLGRIADMVLKITTDTPAPPAKEE